MTYEVIISLFTLIALETVLGVDNIIFISIIAGKLPAAKQKKARRYGLILAMFLRLILLTVISTILQLKEDVFTVFGNGFSVKDLILMGGGLFLLYKSTSEIFHKMEREPEEGPAIPAKATTFGNALLQILIMDMVFSIDSIVTAVGMVRDIWVMYGAVVGSVGIMLFAAEPISKFVNTHPAFKMLALCFLLVIGFALISEGMGVEIPKGYIYFSMAFAFLVDVLQMRMNRKKH